MEKGTPGTQAASLILHGASSTSSNPSPLRIDGKSVGARPSAFGPYHSCSLNSAGSISMYPARQRTPGCQCSANSCIEASNLERRMRKSSPRCRVSSTWTGRGIWDCRGVLQDTLPARDAVRIASGRRVTTATTSSPSLAARCRFWSHDRTRFRREPRARRLGDPLIRSSTCGKLY